MIYKGLNSENIIIVQDFLHSNIVNCFSIQTSDDKYLCVWIDSNPECGKCNLAVAGRDHSEFAILYEKAFNKNFTCCIFHSKVPLQLSS